MTAQLDTAAAGVGMTQVFQPIIFLPDETIVGFEALARWPDLPECEPKTVFTHASEHGTLAALDQLCIDTAIATALRAEVRQGTLLCVNAEPSTDYPGRATDSAFALAHDKLTLMFEITERSLLARPQSLLRKVAALRSDGFLVALDDVGVHPDSLALLDVILPDVIKLDLALVQTQPSYAQARTLAAVLAHHERTGAVILAEGIETEDHLEQALAVGATLGQGFRFGHPGPLERTAGGSWSPPSRPRSAISGGGLSPFDRVAGTATVRTARKETLTALSRNIESQAAHADDRPMVFTALQGHQYFTGATRDRYRELAATCPLVAVFGEDLTSDLGAGLRGVVIDPRDPLAGEWTVVALGPHYATALIAREKTDGDTAHRDSDRRFDFVITYDRPLVAAAAGDLLSRMP